MELRLSPFSSEMNSSVQAPSNQNCNSLSDIRSACSVRMILATEIQESVTLADVRLTDENKFRDIQPTEDEPLIVFEKIVQQKVKRESLTSKVRNIICRFFVKEAPKFNKICRYFNESGFCKHRKKCRFYIYVRVLFRKLAVIMSVILTTLIYVVFYHVLKKNAFSRMRVAVHQKDVAPIIPIDRKMLFWIQTRHQKI